MDWPIHDISFVDAGSFFFRRRARTAAWAVESERDMGMTPENDRAFHLERAEQCRRMAAESTDPTVRQLHEELAAFHDAEAKRDGIVMPAIEDAF